MKEVLENIGLSMAAYREGYVALAEDIISNGRQIDVSLNANDAYFVYKIDDHLSCWGYYSRDEVLSVFACCDTAYRCFSKIIEMTPFESVPSRGVAAMEIGTTAAMENGIKIYAEIINYMLAVKKYRAGSLVGPNSIAINGFINGDSLKIYADEKEYVKAYNGNPAAGVNSIVCLKSVNRDETPVEMTPFAHAAMELVCCNEFLNNYSRERFLNVNALCGGTKLSFFTGFNGEAAYRIREASPGAIIEADVYFTARLL